MNKRYPGRPDYTGPKSGLFLLIHHGEMVEHSHDIYERLDYIDEYKAESERAWRRHCMVYVRPSELPPEVVLARATLDKAYATWVKARATWVKAYATWVKAHATLGKAYDTKARATKACATLEKARATFLKVLKTNNDTLTALLTKFVPDHTWNGEELIFK